MDITQRPRNLLAGGLIVLLGACQEAPADQDKKSEGGGGTPPATTSAPSQKIENIKAADAAAAITAHEGCVVLDIRTPGEFAGGRIAGARNVDFRADDFADQIKVLDRSKTYVVY